MAENNAKTLRLLMPEWQGGDYDLSVGSGELYPLGARLLAFLAPQSGEETVEVPVSPYVPGAKRTKANGVVNQEIVLAQMLAARKILEEKKPARVVTFGGECLVSQAPFDYLNGLYKGNLGVIWIDAHPDVSTPENHDREHAMVLGNLLGGGDPAFSSQVLHPLKPAQVLLVGMRGFDSPKEKETIGKFGLPVIPPEDAGAQPVLAWLEAAKFGNVAIHLDLDSLDPARFFSQLTNDPDAKEKYPTVKGHLDFPRVTGLIRAVSQAANVVGLTIAEYMPWDAMHLKRMMAQLPIMTA
ncbi:MAG: arginase family protein [Desulfovibrio sp.]|nr:arginase family protein [Desulfovibrio sp.]